MEILSRQAKNKSMQMLYRKVVFELNKGTVFSECLEKQGKVFPKMLINMLKTFLPMPSEDIPDDSLLREFIGGSCFKVI